MCVCIHYSIHHHTIEPVQTTKLNCTWNKITLQEKKVSFEFWCNILSTVTLCRLLFNISKETFDMDYIYKIAINVKCNNCWYRQDIDPQEVVVETKPKHKLSHTYL